MNPLDSQLILPSGFPRVPLEAGLAEDSFTPVGELSWGTGGAEEATFDSHPFPETSRFTAQALSPLCLGVWDMDWGSTELGRTTIHYGPPSMHLPGHSDEAQRW